MNMHLTTLCLLLAGLLCFASVPLIAADPHGHAAAPAVAPKPKLAPRAIPGMSKETAEAPAPPVAPVVARKSSPKSGPAASSGTAAEKTRILMVYRRPVEPASLASAAPTTLQPSEDARPLPEPAPRPGFVRVISKAEADALAAQPNP